MERELSNSKRNPIPIKVEFPSTTVFETEEEEPAGSGSGGATAIVQGAMEVPRPLDCLHETPIPPFLSKTYDIVDDCTVDAVISWGPMGNSFVVWDPHMFEKAVLPRNFKHGNFSSFVRQLNTYGFRKISADRWEFANECFLRGNKQLLKNINRRRSHGGGGQASSNSLAIVTPGMESELQTLKRDKNALLQEVFKLQQDQMMTIDRMSSLNQKLLTAEERQKQMVSFLAKILRNPNMLAQFRMHQEQRHRRKFLKHHNQQQHGQSSSLIHPPDAVWNESAAQLEQGNNQLMKELPYLEVPSLPENIFPELLHGSSSGTRPSSKGKGIMEELRHDEYSGKVQSLNPFPDTDDFTGDPNLLELPDAFYDLDLDFDLELGPVDHKVDGQVPTE